MRVLLLTTSTFSAIGGISRYTTHLCRALGELPGVALDVFSLNDKVSDRDGRYLSWERSGIRFRGFQDRRVPYTSAAVYGMLTTDYDVCIVGHAHLLPLMLPLRLLPHRPLSCLIAYGIEVWHPLTRLQRMGLDMCDQVLAISNHTARRLQAVNGPIEKVSVVHNALDPFWTAEATLLSQQGKPVSSGDGVQSLLTVSRLTRSERDKGHALIIKALSDVLEAVPEVRYDVVGGGDLIPELRQLAKDCGVQDRVRFHGRVDDVHLHQFYRDCDVFVMPSKKEGFGYVYLEAMYYGKPVLAGATDAGSEVIRHNQTGLIVDPDDHDAMITALIRLLQNSRLRQDMGQAGKQLVEESYTFDRFRRQLAECLMAEVQPRKI